jgi:hypothetical protein
MLSHVRDPGRFVAPALARYQEEMSVIGVEGDLGVRRHARRIRNPSGGIERDKPQGRDPEERETRGRTAARQPHQGHDTEGGAAIDDQSVQFVQARRQALKNREQCASRRRIQARGTTDQDENWPSPGQAEFAQGGRQALGRGSIQAHTRRREQGG